MKIHKSPLLLTDPCDKAHCMVGTQMSMVSVINCDRNHHQVTTLTVHLS